MEASPLQLDALILRARKKDPRAFQELMATYYRSTYAVALSRVGNPADAEEVAQETFLVAFRELAQCRDPRKFPGWLLQIARNRAHNFRTSRSARTHREEAVGSLPLFAPQAMPDHGLRRTLLQGLEQLTAVEREIVLLHDLDDWTHPEIADALGISAVASRQHLFQARQKLRLCLKATLELEGRFHDA